LIHKTVQAHPENPSRSGRGGPCPPRFEEHLTIPLTFDRTKNRPRIYLCGWFGMQEPKVLIRGNLNPETYKTLSHLAVDRGVTRSKIVEEAVEAYLKAVADALAKKGGA
jgi:ribbon-helix-helix CopG family protein